MENFERYVGVVLDNRYKIEKVVGIGGMAVVFRAEDILMRRTVAVKMLKEDVAKDEQSVRRFLNESKAVSMLSHPNIVRIFDVSMKEREQYIVMEYIEGITLKTYMTRRGALSLREMIGFTEQILRALEHAHVKGIVHRDIKPQNIMLLKNGVVKVTDFGIAKLPNAETVTVTDQAIGTVYYISPEQASGGEIDARSDIYSLGVMMYEMATGQLPFNSDSPVSVALKQINDEAKKPREINSEIPKGLEQIIGRAMEKQPDMRYQDATQMLRQLTRLKEDPSAEFKTPFKLFKKKDGEVKQSKAMFPIILGVAIPFAIAAIVSFVLIVSSLFSGSGDGSETITVKDFVGQKFSENMQEFFDNSEYYKLNLVQVYSDTEPAGKILKQEPEAGTTRKVNKGTKFCEIKLTVSRGTRTAVMPDVTVLDYREAKLMLEKMGIELKIVTESQVNSVFEIGTVISTVPVAGDKVESGDTVTLYVSSGPTSEKIEMPNLVGKNEGEALKGLLLEHLFPGDVTYEASSKPKGTVISQSVRAGDEICVNTFINFTVSGGKDYGKKPEKTTKATEKTTKATKKTEKTSEVSTEPAVTETETTDILTETVVTETEMTETELTEETVTVEVTEADVIEDDNA